MKYTLLGLALWVDRVDIAAAIHHLVDVVHEVLGLVSELEAVLAADLEEGE